MTTRLSIILLVTLCAACSRVTANREKPQPLQISAAGIDAAEPATAAAPDGSFYVAWVNHAGTQADVMLAHFDQNAAMQGSPVRVNRTSGVATAWRGDQPSLAVSPNGDVHVLWTARVDALEKHGTTVYLSTSSDHGQSFATEVQVNDDKLVTDHGMHSLAISHDGRIYAAWLDERNVSAPTPSSKPEAHQMESNRDLYLTYSTDGGRTFSANKKVASEACPCCKTSLAVAPDGTLYAGWRQVLPGSFRHIAVASSTDGGVNFSSPTIVSDDRWVLQGCPVSGPSLSIDRASGNLKVLWYAAGEGSEPALYVAESRDKGHSFSPRELIWQTVVRGTAALVIGESNTIALWQSSDKMQTNVHELKTGAPVSIFANAELPAGVFSHDKLFVAYIVSEKEKRSIWLLRADYSVPVRRYS